METVKMVSWTSGFGKRALLLAIFLIINFLIDNFSPIMVRSSLLYTYLGRPLIWFSIISTALVIPKVHPSGKLRHKDMLQWMCTLLSGGIILIMMLAGIVTGFGKSPYNHTLSGIITNLLLVYCPLIGRELIRNHLINSPSVKKNIFFIGLITILMTICNLSFDMFESLKTNLEITKYVSNTILPELSNNILASYLVFIGGPSLSIIYLGIQEGFYWFFPILPNIDWLIKGLICTLGPIFSLMIIQFVYKKQMKITDDDEMKSENPISWIITCILSISIIWFAVGVFPIRPMVIATGSMEPIIYAGDMVLVKRIPAKELKVGDIIQYKSGKIFIFHRIIKVVDDKQKIKYETKGDNNSAVDHELVTAENINGKVVYIIPKIGWPVVFLKEDRSQDKSKVEF